MIAHIIALSLFGHSAIQSADYRVDRWRVQVSHDSFTGAVQCRATSGNLRISGDQLLVRLGSGTDTTQAAYRIDGGPAAPAYTTRLPWSEVAGAWGNPSAGRIPVPLSQLQSASTLAVRASPNASIRTFDVRSVPQVLAELRRQACPASS